MPDILQFYKFVYLPQHEVLKFRVQFVEQAGNPLHFFFRRIVEHTPLPGEQPVFIDGKSPGNEMDKAVFDLVMAQFNPGKVAVRNIYCLGKSPLR